MKMNAKMIITAASVLMGMLLNLSVSEVQASELTIADGAKLYNDNCARCHNPKPAESYTAAEWSVIMPHMREKAHLTGTETRAIERFIAATLTADVQQSRSKDDSLSKMGIDGEALFENNGCGGCHQISGSGGTMGPDLEESLTTRGAQFMVEKILNPALGNPSSTMPKFPVSEAEASAIVEYIRIKTGS